MGYIRLDHGICAIMGWNGKFIFASFGWDGGGRPIDIEFDYLICDDFDFELYWNEMYWIISFLYCFFITGMHWTCKF